MAASQNRQLTRVGRQRVPLKLARQAACGLSVDAFCQQLMRVGSSSAKVTCQESNLPSGRRIDAMGTYTLPL
jgi:hypothetical protein